MGGHQKRRPDWNDRSLGEWEHQSGRAGQCKSIYLPQLGFNQILYLTQ